MTITSTHNELSVGELPLNQFIDTSTVGKTTALEFIASELGKDIDLLLMFEPPKVGKLYVDLFPLCWKVLSFSSVGISSAIIEFSANTGFFAPQFQAGNRVAASNAQHCEVGQRCTLKTNMNGSGNYINPPVSGSPDAIQCVNGTDEPANLGIGYFNEAGTKIEPTHVWQNISKGSTLSVQPTNKLRIYAVSNVKANELIKGDIESQLLFDRSLPSLPSYTEWTISLDEETGEVKIKQA